MNILYTINNKYLDIMLVSFLSLYNNSNLDNIILHVITEDFSHEDYYKLQNFISNFKNTKLYIYPLESFNIEKYGIPKWRNTNISNARIFFASILRYNLDDIDNLLYIDSDTIVKGPLDDLYKYNNNTISLTKDFLNKYYFNGYGLEKYYNSGVIYFNVKNWLNQNLEDEIIKKINKNTNYRYPDQDLINTALKDIIKELPLKYNFAPHNLMFNDLGLKLLYNPKTRIISDKEAKAAKEDIRIMHSCGILSIKPWMNQNINPMTEEFMTYMNMINSNFKREELSKLKKLLSEHKELFKLLLILRSHTPSFIEDKVRKLIVKN
ncbi:MAG: hypothetical protein IJ572_00450 [Bacilli bacterium]|nr:hypothetical protein [Bacilli bacterium]